MKEKPIYAAMIATVLLALLGFFLMSSLDFKLDWGKSKEIPAGQTKSATKSTSGDSGPDEEAAPSGTVAKKSKFLARLMDRLLGYRRQMEGRGAIPNEVVLQFKDKAAYDKFLADAAAAGFTIKGTLPSLMAIRAGFADEEKLASWLSKNPDTDSALGANYTVSPPEVPTAADRTASGDVPFGGSALGFIGATNNSTWGSGVTVAVLDSAVSPEGVFGSNLSGLQIATSPTTDLSHGTAVASLAAGAMGVAQAANILSVGVVGADGFSDTFTLASGIMAAVDAGAKVLNVSLGSYSGNDILAQSVAYAIAHGAVIVASTGNDGYNNSTYPARYEGVVAAGAVDAYGQVVSFSNSSMNYGLTSPGLEVLAAIPGGQQELFSGTSASAPFVTGAIASVMAAYPSMSAQDAVALLRLTANDAGAPGADADYGYGTINLERALNVNTPNRIDLAVSSQYYNPNAQGGPTMTYVVQNRGTTSAFNWQLQTTTGTAAQTWALPSLSPNQITSVTVPINTAQLSANGSMNFQSQLTVPTGIKDLNTTNNAKASVVSKKK